jgi:hypothetical protein
MEGNICGLFHCTLSLLPCRYREKSEYTPEQKLSLQESNMGPIEHAARILKFVLQILTRMEEKYITRKNEHFEELVTPSFLTRYNLRGKEKIINLRLQNLAINICDNFDFYMYKLD